jgi:hypothetical protein
MVVKCLKTLLCVNILNFSLNNSNNNNNNNNGGLEPTTQVARHDFLVSFLVDARGGALNGCRHTGVKVINKKMVQKFGSILLSAK